MKKILFTIGISLALGHAVLLGQSPNRYVPKTWINLTNKRTISEVYLYEMRDSSIAISNVLTTDQPIDFKINYVESIKVQDGGNAWTGLAIGLAVGVVGGVVGLASLPKCDKDDGWCELENAIVGPTVIAGYGLGGGLIGGLLGASVQSTIPINGSYEKYHDQKEKLREYSVLK